MCRNRNQTETGGVTDTKHRAGTMSEHQAMMFRGGEGLRMSEVTGCSSVEHRRAVKGAGEGRACSSWFVTFLKEMGLQ